VQIHFEEVDMIHYREILRFTALGCSQREICASVSVSQKIVSRFRNELWSVNSHRRNCRSIELGASLLARIGKTSL